MEIPKKNVVVIGGGTGTYTLLRGLKAYADTITISAIVTMADSGGSTGRLRDEFGQLPVGDVRMTLVALATEVDTHAELLRELFLYRFVKGEGLSGHNFGNLFLTALTDILGDTSVAVETAAELLRVKGAVIPVTTDDVHLVATYNTGVEVVGEHHIDVPEVNDHANLITHLRVTPVATINPKARLAIAKADIIVLGPGDLYTSILANCVVDGVAEAIRDSKAQLVYVCNLMSRSGQTIGMHSGEYLGEIEKYVGRRPDHMLYNSTEFPELLLQKYLREGNHPVKNNYRDDTCITHSCDLVSSESFVTVAGDTIERSLIRHDTEKLAAAIVSLL